MKTVGILTFHSALNYGAVLQAFALKNVCDDLGYEAHIINYKPDYLDDEPKPLVHFRSGSHSPGDAFKCVRGMMSYVGDRRRWRNFTEFRAQYLNESVQCHTIQEIETLKYDVYIAGSDQIWNYQITGDRFDPVFFLQLDTPATKIIYAASAQDVPFPLDKEMELRAMLGKVDASVGIREQKLADYVAGLVSEQYLDEGGDRASTQKLEENENFISDSYPVVLDPTLLAGRKGLDRIPDREFPKKPYILIYQIDSNPASDISVKTLERRFQCNVYTMTVPRIGSVHGRKGEVGPEAFLSLLKHAEFLVTNSFHGIALALLYEKQFFVYENGGVMSRIDSLLEAVGLTNRKVKLVADIAPERGIDYSSVRGKLQKLQEESMRFLTDSLAGKKRAGQSKQSFSEKEEIQSGAWKETHHQKRKPGAIKAMKDRQKKDCCGCSACADACPMNAIVMKKDSEGFLYPFIHEDKCIHCGKCDRICGFAPMKHRAEPYQLPKAYGVKHIDDRERDSSRSGGAFIAFSDLVLASGGVVYGAAMQEDFSVCHIRAASKEDRDRMKKAKYVQSNTVGIYAQVGKDLKGGLPVLFSGTPCQVSALHAFLKEQRISDDRLVCCDLVCHGTPSPAIWKDYVGYISKKYNAKILNAEFRDKEFGWDSHCESFVLENRAKKVVSRDYTDLFYEHIMFRPSCHACPFANVYRPGDLSLADFWGIEKNDASFNDNRGVSLVLINTEKGAQLFEQAKPQLHSIACQIENCIQPTLVKPSAASPRREEFWNDYGKMEFPAFLKKYTTPLSTPLRIKRTLKNVMYHLGIRKHP